MNIIDVGMLDAELDRMLHNKLHNYIVPGLHSSLVGGGTYGKVRMFECERNHTEAIIPHSHRFDFVCLVLAGEVRNCIWSSTEPNDSSKYCVCEVTYGGGPGQYNIQKSENRGLFGHRDTVYKPGDVYKMRSHEIHSIQFSAETRVLFFEGPERTDTTYILQPLLNDGSVVPTFKVEPWMFLREDGV